MANNQQPKRPLAAGYTLTHPRLRACACYAFDRRGSRCMSTPTTDVPPCQSVVMMAPCVPSKCQDRPWSRTVFVKLRGRRDLVAGYLASMTSRRKTFVLHTLSGLQERCASFSGTSRLDAPDGSDIAPSCRVNLRTLNRNVPRTDVCVPVCPNRSPYLLRNANDIWVAGRFHFQDFQMLWLAVGEATHRSSVAAEHGDPEAVVDGKCYLSTDQHHVAVIMPVAKLSKCSKDQHIRASTRSHGPT